MSDPKPGDRVTPENVAAIEARLKAADEVHPPVTRWELRCAHGLTMASKTTPPPEGWNVNGGRCEMCRDCEDDEAEDVPAKPFVYSWTTQGYTVDKMSKEDVRILLARVRELEAALGVVDEGVPS